MSSVGPVGEDFGGQGALMGPLGTILEPLWIQVWDFRGPKGQKYENPLFFTGFSMFLEAPAEPSER